MKRHNWMRFLVLAAALGGVAPAGAAVLSRSAEISLGREGAQEFERQASVDGDPVLAARVRRIGSRLIATAGNTGYPFEFHAVETNDVNAFALPGGFIYMFRGLTQLAPGDDALAFILAHEITHVTRRHGVRQLEKSLAVGTILDLAVGRTTSAAVLQLVLDMHYSRQDETEADRLGLELMARAGFDPTQGAEAMAMLARAVKTGRSIPPFLRSHPLPESRIVRLRQQAEVLRAAPRAPRTGPAPPPLPEVRPLPSPRSVARSELFPLEPGMRWTYRVTGSAEPLSMVTRVLEEQPGQPGVYRVRTEMGSDLVTTRYVAVSTEGVCVYQEQGRTDSLTPGRHPAAVGERGIAPRAGGAWRPELRLPAEPASEDTAAIRESIRVPAGEYSAVRAVQRLPGGETATVWLSPGIGIVRRVWDRTGLVEELEAVHRPAQEEGPKTKAGEAPAPPRDRARP
jgi:Zn-dependent protease with chaperone function